MAAPKRLALEAICGDFRIGFLRLNREVRSPIAMEGPTLDSEPYESRHSVLIVDESEETREVLETALERRGMRTFVADRVDPGLALARRHHPDLIVLDLELDENNPERVHDSFAEQSRADNGSLVMLGTIRRRGVKRTEGEFIAKPYHYGPLIRKIEELLQAASPSAR